MTPLRLVAASVFAFVAVSAVAAPLAYVPNEGSATVSVIDTATDKVTATLKFGQKPRGIAVSLDGKSLYLSDQTLNALVVVDTEKRVEIARVPLGDSPEAIYLSPDGKWISAAIEENDQVVRRRYGEARRRPQAQDEGQESGARRVEPRRQVAVRERRGGRFGGHRRPREGRGRQVGESRRPAARNRLPARRQPRLRGRRERRHGQRDRHRRSTRSSPGSRCRAARTASSSIPTASASTSRPAARAPCRWSIRRPMRSSPEIAGGQAAHGTWR